MKKIELLKKAVRMIVTVGSGHIIKQIVEGNVDASSTTEKVTVTAASYAIGGAVGEFAGQYTDRQIDELVELIKEIKDRKTK